MIVLLSIKPEFASAIFTGVKRYEYRRSIFKRSVKRIVVYASAPISKVIGEFEVGELLCHDVEELWRRTGEHGGVSRDVFTAYFKGKQRGYAIEVRNPSVYERPHCPRVAYGKLPPQSFAYIGTGG
jgi:predicted transcriptional regulator